MENAKKNDEFQGRIGSLNRDKGYLKKFMKYFGIIILGLFLKTFLFIAIANILEIKFLLLYVV